MSWVEQGAGYQGLSSMKETRHGSLAPPAPSHWKMREKKGTTNVETVVVVFKNGQCNRGYSFLWGMCNGEV